MFEDVDRRLRTQGTPQNSWSVGKPVHDLEYADDTMLIGVTPTQLEDMLCSVQVEASLYGLSLNFDKTELLRHPNHPATIKFANGRNVPVTESVKYLGSQVTWEKPTKAALQARAQQAHVSFLKLQHVWQSKLPWKVKSRIFHSCIVPSYLHGLSTLTLEKTHFKTIDGWYFRYLRRALKIKSSYYSRISNKRVWKCAGRPVLPSQTLLSSQFKLLTQSITTPPDKPQHHVVFSPGYKDRVKFTKSKSRGHPARYWFELVSSEAIRYLNHHIDHSAPPRTEGYRRDFLGPLGLKQHLNLDPSFGDRLTTAPTRAPTLFPLYQKTVGCAWQA